MCEGVGGDGEQKMLLRIQDEEKESLEVSCFRGQLQSWNVRVIQESWPRGEGQIPQDVRSWQGGQPHLNL